MKYGCLKGDWKEQLSKGFDECMRVLRPNGILVFKWSEQRIALADILKCFSQRPLFGNRCRKKGNTTHWLCFMKDEPILSQDDRKTEPNSSEKPNNSTISKMEQVDKDINVRSKDEPQTCSFSACDNFKNPDYERCIECKRKQIKLKTEQTERSE